jgi:chromate transport protein ChrA
MLIVFSLRGLRRVSAAACRHVLWLSMPLLTAALTIAAVLAFVRRWWTARERVSYAAFTAVAVAFIVFLNCWKLLGVRC